MKETLRFSTISECGPVREQNEDNLATYRHESGWPCAFIVADGMGGHQHGELASRIAVDYCRDRLAADLGSLNQPERLESLLSDVIQKANIKVYLKSLEDQRNSGMGTTLTMAVFFQDSVYVAHIGDSRCYILRGGVMEKLSRDHTVVQDLLDAKTITEEEGATHPQRHILTQALGVPEYLQPEVLHLDLKRHDRFLLCSDGLHGFVDDFSLGETLRMSTDPDSCARDLVDLALKKGSNDNITAIVIFA